MTDREITRQRLIEMSWAEVQRLVQRLEAKSSVRDFSLLKGKFSAFVVGGDYERSRTLFEHVQPKLLSQYQHLIRSRFFYRGENEPHYDFSLPFADLWPQLRQCVEEHIPSWERIVKGCELTIGVRESDLTLREAQNRLVEGLQCRNIDGEVAAILCLRPELGIFVHDQASEYFDEIDEVAMAAAFASCDKYLVDWWLERTYPQKLLVSTTFIHAIYRVEPWEGFPIRG